MSRLLRTVTVAFALLSSGALQAAAAMGDDPCCAEETDAPVPDCPPGVACACCPTRGAVRPALPELAPARTEGVALAVAAQEPSAAAPPADIFHPPRA